MELEKLGKDKGSGSLLGSILLIAGSCIGIGILGLPVNTAMAGFQPTVAMFILSWLFMTTTGLLLLEVNLHFPQEVNLITMADKTLGKIGSAAAWFLFLFLFYCIMVAYSSGSGELVADFGEEVFSVAVPKWIGSIGFVAILGIAVYWGTFAVDRLNRILMAGLILTYLLFISAGAPHVRQEFLYHVDWSQCLWALPVMIISFGYHNLIPSLTTYLNFNVKRMRIAILLGSAIPLFCYLLLEWVLLGLIPAEAFATAMEEGNMVTHTMKEVVGKAWIVDVIESFAFFAIVTSFIGVALSLVDFLADGLQLKKNRRGRGIACFLALVPPLLFSLVYPKVFIHALNFAGGFGAVILFGVLPVFMVWSGRYRRKLWSEALLPGGKFTLLLIALFGGAIFALQLYSVFIGK